MELSDKEELLIKEGKLHDIIRWDKPTEKVGDIVFEVDGKPYRLVDKKRWKLFRVAAQRSHIDFSCKSVYDFKLLMGELYKPYPKIKDDTIYLCVIKDEKSQMTLGV